MPEELDREFLLHVLLARENLQSTGIGEGVAIPHVRNPIVLHVPRPLVTLCFLDQPVDFEALDGKPVHALFSLICPTVRAHLALLSRLAFALHDARFKRVIAEQGPADEVLAEAGARGARAGAAHETRERIAVDASATARGRRVGRQWCARAPRCQDAMGVAPRRERGGRGLYAGHHPCGARAGGLGQPSRCAWAGRCRTARSS